MSLTVITETHVDASLLQQLKTITEESGQVILHFLYKTPFDQIMNIRIWPTSYLYDVHSDHRSELVHAENIVYYPFWMPCFPGEKIHFTLIFTGLPKACTLFDFVEVCDNEYGHFEARNIPRNQTDVYYLEIT